MTMLNRPADGADIGETVASMREYERAQKTVSQLIAGEVPARDIAIVGQGVRTVEKITGRLGYAAAARSGAINGLLIGLLLSAIMVLGTPDAPIQLFVAYLFIGVAIGMLLSLVTFAIVRRRRDFASVTQLAADHYEVTVLPTSLAKARQVLGGGQRPAAARPPVNLDEPPRYGERVTPGQSPDGSAPAGPVPASSAPSVTGAQPVIPPRPADPRPRYGERVADAPATSTSPTAPTQPSAPTDESAPVEAEPDAPEAGADAPRKPVSDD
ncbi:general stress protein [Microbacterium sp. NPDC056234]|uniref:general stress protein n=1 Tax=Microbacterium sp. NPDC056234 TaxID=3345757 RepID=UPI0035D63589